VSTVENFANNRNERFNGNGMDMMSPYKGENFIVVLITFLIIVLIISLIGQFLWNYVVHGKDALFNGANKAKNIWQILALYILVALFIGK
jgi:heme/copper-type cytochrome/quinol oxidase subunit 2